MPVTPLLPDDPPKVGDFWLDARLGVTPAGIAFTAHDAANTPAMVILLSEGAAADAAARARLAGEINRLHIDTVLARGGHGQDTGRLGRKYRRADDPIAPDDRFVAPWAALAYDGSPAAAAQAMWILDAVQIATLPPQGVPVGPDYQQYWIDRVRPGLAPLAAAVAGPLRPGRLANDLGVVAPHAAARGAGSTYRDLDLPQSTPTVPSSAHRQLRRAATVRIAPVRHTIRVPAVPGTIGIPILRVAWTVGHRIGRRGADGIRDWIASRKQHSTLEAVVVSAAIKTSESLVSAPGTYAATAQKGLLVRLAGWLGIFTLPVLVALYVGATTFDGTSCHGVRSWSISRCIAAQVGLACGWQPL